MGKLVRTIVLLCVCVASGRMFADVEVSDIQVFSGFPWPSVVIGYTIRGKIEGIARMVIRAVDKETDETYICNKISKVDFSEGRHMLLWRPDNEGIRINSARMVFTVEVYDYPLYKVIDLSKKSQDGQYSVENLQEVPASGWTDEYKTNKLVLRCVDAGAFVRNGITVTLTKPFYIGVFEVTQAQYANVTGADPSYFHGEMLPVERVSWNTAFDFVSTMQKKTGLSFGLPTEAQWELACRAGTDTTYYYGNEPDGAYMWCRENSNLQTHVVGLKKPNAFGLYDMCGNVSEWCADWRDSYVEYPYSVTDPQGPSSGTEKKRRGGCYSSSMYSGSVQGGINSDFTSSGRQSDYPHTANAVCGFRLSLNVE